MVIRPRAAPLIFIAVPILPIPLSCVYVIAFQDHRWILGYIIAIGSLSFLTYYVGERIHLTGGSVTCKKAGITVWQARKHESRFEFGDLHGSWIGKGLLFLNKSNKLIGQISLKMYGKPAIDTIVSQISGL